MFYWEFVNSRLGTKESGRNARVSPDGKRKVAHLQKLGTMGMRRGRMLGDVQGREERFFNSKREDGSFSGRVKLSKRRRDVLPSIAKKALASS